MLRKYKPSFVSAQHLQKFMGVDNNICRYYEVDDLCVDIVTYLCCCLECGPLWALYRN